VQAGLWLATSVGEHRGHVRAAKRFRVCYGTASLSCLCSLWHCLQEKVFEGRPLTSVIFPCPKCGLEGPLNVEIRESTEPGKEGGVDPTSPERSAWMRHQLQRCGSFSGFFLELTTDRLRRELPCASPCKPAGTEVRFSSKVVSRVR
jgi:hypothetical protein